MKLSVIIVNYNVRYFLEKCVGSVLRALEGIEGEVIVIDNHSSDHSAEVIRSHFATVRLIVNAENLGFAKACNQGLIDCSGEYALLLNPDTLVSEDTFKRCVEFMDSHPEASACGVRMVDGTGRFLPESMRGLPTPLTAFFKMTGISRLIPRSMFFNGYYMGSRDPGQVHQVPVLTGAFMFMRMSVIRKIGMLDEDYFMYGEDIDLCYRMVKNGYQNYYLPGPSIIHYKGESTHRGSIKYIIHFYRAMMIYVSKHVHGVGGRLFKIMILLGVVIRGLGGGVRRIIVRALPVLIDAGLIAGFTLFVKSWWAKGYFHDVDHFDVGFYRVNLPLFTGIWLLFLFLSGAHDKQRNARRISYGMGMGTVAILVVYAILPLEYRSSRAVIFIAAALITVGMVLWTGVTNYIKEKWRSPGRMVIVGSSDEVGRIMEIMNRADAKKILVGWIATREDDDGPSRIGHETQLKEIIAQHGIGEIIFSATDMSFGEINGWMSRIGPSLAYRISTSGSGQIVGSDSKHAQGTLYTADVEFALAYPSYRRLKRIFDVTSALLLLCIWPVVALIRNEGRGQFRQILSVLKGDKTWIGYHPDDTLLSELPALKPGVYTIVTRKSTLYEKPEIHMINYIYAREYSVWKDFDLFLRKISKLN